MGRTTKLGDLTEQLLWSVWTELGVPGTTRAHQDVVIDPEPLIVFTPLLARNDSRLLGLAFDWCISHAGHISAARMNGLAKVVSEPVRRELAAFNGCLTEYKVRWKPAASGLNLVQTRKTMALPTERPALLAFRLRGLAGVSVRADILCRLLMAPTNGLDSHAVRPSGSARRTVEVALADLLELGVVTAQGTSRRRRFHLRNRQDLSRFCHAENLQWWDWTEILSVLEMLQRLENLAGMKPNVQRVEGTAIRKRLDEAAVNWDQNLPPLLLSEKNPHERVLSWGEKMAAGFANGRFAE